MVELRSWLKEHGCCGLCAIGIAIAQVEREHGDTTFKATRAGCSKKDGTDCFELARVAIKAGTMPKETP